MTTPAIVSGLFGRRSSKKMMQIDVSGMLNKHIAEEITLSVLVPSPDHRGKTQVRDPSDPARWVHGGFPRF